MSICVTPKWGYNRDLGRQSLWTPQVFSLPVSVLPEFPADTYSFVPWSLEYSETGQCLH